MRMAAGFEVNAAANSVRCRVQVNTIGKTGIAMEGLTAVRVDLLTVYDM